jgi:threonine/homoserine/homoserine lactone efflux protein
MSALYHGRQFVVFKIGWSDQVLSRSLPLAIRERVKEMDACSSALRRSGGFFCAVAGLSLRGPAVFVALRGFSSKGASDNMDTSFYLRGLAIGFSIAAVVGPIGVLCISRTLQKGFLSGFVTGMGAATADGICGSIAAFGLTMISTVLVSLHVWIRLVGGLFLIYLGIKAMLTKPAERAAKVGGSNFLSMYFSTTLLTLTNPLTILSFAAVFAGLGVGTAGKNTLAAALVATGVFCGSSLWWLLLSGGVGLLREKLTSGWLIWINRLAGAVLMIFGMIVLISLIR